MTLKKCFIVLIPVINIITGISADVNCCTPGQALLLKTNECWDPKTNVTNKVKLQCNEFVRISKNFAVEGDSLRISLPIGSGINETIPPEQFCLANGTVITDVTLSRTKLKAVFCAEEDEEMWEDQILGYCMIVSVIFLSATAVIYSLLPELRDIQGKSIINFCTSLAIALGILVIMKLMAYSDMALCATRGFLAYYFVLVAFFWTNAISIQILLSTRRPVSLDYSWREFKWYMMYAWGCPALLTFIMAIVNYHPGDHNRPGIGLNHCWFFTKQQQWIYMYSFMTLLLSANVCIFIYTSIVIWRISFSANQVKALKYKFLMSARLILIMGLPWVFEMISSLSPKHIILTLIDIFNTLQGLFIFLLLVVFRRRVVKLMHQRGWLSCVSGAIERHLAREDDEEHVVQHQNIEVTMNETTILQ